MKRSYCFVIALQILCWVSATSRPFPPNDGVGVHQEGPGQNPESLQVTLQEGLNTINGVTKMAAIPNYRGIAKIGSSPPSCDHKCYGCTPCEAIQDSCPSVKNILLLDSEGKRVAVKYFSDDWPTNGAKLAFEKSIFTKTLKTNARIEAEIMMFDSNVIIYKFIQDLHFFVTGGDDENELILATVLQGFFDAVALLLRNNVDKREALENLDLILLCFDEIVDGGMVLETDPSIIAGKVATHTMDADAPLSEQTITQAWATAREHLTRTLLK
ncbi:coatomer subunit zeta-2-like [Prunus yedoensis var. nudiflora]|uniref:Coatomer subunit zeta n=1 Tax=Prunus yedoensis var. nudiflora TaxID=2094558 RepID=A0A314XSD0_PRUYE|nr:coatomer subunit zeta-2-like [Prunus yedoensis var. nudiflora]